MSRKKKHKPRAEGDWKGVRRSGGGEYRYGTMMIGPGQEVELKSRISLAGPKPSQARIFRGEHRQAIINRLVDEMSDWRYTPFEFEGPFYHGIRSSLCLEGHSFHASDVEAVVLVGQALHSIGVERPTWAQGQRSYTAPRDACLRCGRPVDVMDGRTVFSFCSVVCAKLTLERRDFQRRNQTDLLYAAAWRIIARTRTVARSCAWCGDLFHPDSESSRQACCGQSCAMKLRWQQKPVQMRSCAFCQGEFECTDARATFCTKTCAHYARKLQRGRAPKILKPQVFDWWAMQQGLRITTTVAVV